jgi:endonuclease/exonuclease/phosphatase family metal-dependent hydrolase
VRIATFNILHGRSPEDGRVDVDRDQPRSMGADLTAVAAEAMDAPEHEFVAALNGTPGGTWMAATGEEQPGSATYGIALLSRYPVVSWRVVRLPPLRASVPMWSTWNNRPFMARDEPRVAVAAVVDGPFGEFTVCNTHLSFIPGWSARQLRLVVRSLTGTPEPLVVIGDLNMQTSQATRLTGMRSIAAAPTFPAEQPTRQIDHVLVRGPLRAAGSAEAVRLPLSDHRALVVDCEPG